MTNEKTGSSEAGVIFIDRVTTNLPTLVAKIIIGEGYKVGVGGRRKEMKGDESFRYSDALDILDPTDILPPIVEPKGKFGFESWFHSKATRTTDERAAYIGMLDLKFQPWRIDVYGMNNTQKMVHLAERLSKEFNRKVHVVLESEKQHREYGPSNSEKLRDMREVGP